MALTANAQNLQKLFDKYGNDERFSYVSVGKGAMNMATMFGGMKGKEKDMIGKMNGVKILSLESGSDERLIKNVLDDLDKIIASGNFESLAEVRDKGERVNIYVQSTGKDSSEMLIVTRDKNELNLIWISGRMTKEEMMKSFSDKGKLIDDVASVSVVVIPMS
jgi:hypothetical protein